MPTAFDAHFRAFLDTTSTSSSTASTSWIPVSPPSPIRSRRTPKWGTETRSTCRRDPGRKDDHQPRHRIRRVRRRYPAAPGEQPGLERQPQDL